MRYDASMSTECNWVRRPAIEGRFLRPPVGIKAMSILSEKPVAGRVLAVVGAPRPELLYSWTLSCF